MNRSRCAVSCSLLALSLAGCADLDLANPNEPDLHSAFSSAAEVESHVAAAFHDWYTVQTAFSTPAKILSGVAFQHSTWNVCLAPYAEIPRRPVENEIDRQCVESVTAWKTLYDALVKVADGLAVLEARPELRSELGTVRAARLHAFARFVQGLAHGSLALLFDRGARVDETTDRADTLELLDYPALMEAALGYLDEAAALSGGAEWPSIPASWAGAEIAVDQLALLARSYAAQLRANVARTPAERDAVDWEAVLADARAGITRDWLVGDGEDWVVHTLAIAHSDGQPTQASYFILGMADQSGSYQRWLSRPLHERVPNPGSDGDAEEAPILIVTADTRFPRGTTPEDQIANDGTLFVIPSIETTGRDASDMWRRPDRGTWRWSYYRYTGANEYVRSADAGWSLLTVAELRLLEAEALLRLGDRAGAAALVNESRTAHGLSPADAAGTNAECVPRLPDGMCGGLMEMLKWEKRLETLWSGPFLASWYFDGRGWGDLYAGTFLQMPVPCSELVLIGLECYTFGGTGNAWSSPGSGYRWPFEAP